MFTFFTIAVAFIYIYIYIYKYFLWQSKLETVCRVAGELEADSVALERIREYEELPQERPWSTDLPLSQVNTCSFTLSEPGYKQIFNIFTAKEGKVNPRDT